MLTGNIKPGIRLFIKFCAAIIISFAILCLPVSNFHASSRLSDLTIEVKFENIEDFIPEILPNVLKLYTYYEYKSVTLNNKFDAFYSEIYIPVLLTFDYQRWSRGSYS